MKNIRIAIFISFVGVMVLLGFGYLIIDAGQSAHDNLPVLYPVPDFELYQAENVTFSKSDLLNKVSVVDFVFTNCQGPCPTMAVKMKRLYDNFEDADDVQLVSISVDPKRDSFQALKAYGESLGVNDDRWIFLRDEIEEVAQLCEGGFKLAADSLPMGHTVMFVLIDQQGNIRGYYDGTNDYSITNLIGHIKTIRAEKPEQE